MGASRPLQKTVSIKGGASPEEAVKMILDFLKAKDPEIVEITVAMSAAVGEPEIAELEAAIAKT